MQESHNTHTGYSKITWLINFDGHKTVINDWIMSVSKSPRHLYA